MSQSPMDSWLQVGAGVGAAGAAAALGASPGVVLGGAAVGGALGVLTHVVTSRPEVLTTDNVPSEAVKGGGS